jgi:hypothetical protein
MPLVLQVITVEPGGLTEDHSKKARLLLVSWPLICPAEPADDAWCHPRHC